MLMRAGLLAKAAAAALARLEQVGVVEKDGSEFVLAETIKNETCIAYCDDAVAVPRSLGESRGELAGRK